MEEKIKSIKTELENDLQNVDLNDSNAERMVEDLRVKYLGKKSPITELSSSLRDVAPENRRAIGMAINEVRNLAENTINELKEKIAQNKIKAEIMGAKKIDISMPTDLNIGSLHPRTIIQKEIEDAFVSMGFIVEDGPEIETEYNNFDAVNVPATHPARDAQDTFWLDNGQVLKTQTSAAQNRILRKYGVPCKVLFPGRCFRNEALDASHENTFFQMEGVVVGENISVANLLYFIKQMLKGVFKKEIEIRCRPGFFPFTEPSFEVDAKCPFCGGKGCSTCKGGGWIELCPCGMIHPNVLREAGIDPDKYNGFAFGLGFDRLVMIKSGLKDIRGLNSGDLKILKQFKTKM